jgi:hypothetical protein
MDNPSARTRLARRAPALSKAQGFIYAPSVDHPLGVRRERKLEKLDD